MALIVDIASVPDRDSWVAEIWDGSNLIAEISRDESSIPILELYNINEAVIRVNLAEFCQALADAQKKLGLI